MAATRCARAYRVKWGSDKGSTYWATASNVTGPLVQHRLLGVLGLRAYFYYYLDVAMTILNVEMIYVAQIYIFLINSA